MVVSTDVTQILKRLQAGDDRAHDDLFRVVYTEIHRRAQFAMRRQPAEHTLQPTALVNEAYLRLFRGQPRGWSGREHFIRAATRSMRTVLVDHARAKACKKRTPIAEPVPVYAMYESHALDILALNEALDELSVRRPVHAEIVELRFFGGATMDEIATITDSAKRTVEYRFQFARAWLKDRLGEA